jgi:hypothetical protein
MPVDFTIFTTCIRTAGVAPLVAHDCCAMPSAPFIAKIKAGPTSSHRMRYERPQ